MKEQKPEHLEKIPNDELEKMQNTLLIYLEYSIFKLQLRLEPTLQHCWQAHARKADLLTFTFKHTLLHQDTLIYEYDLSCLGQSVLSLRHLI